MALTDDVIARRIVELRDRRNWSQGELATALRAHGLNWSQGTLSRVETGARPVRLSETEPLLAVLNVSLSDFVDIESPADAAVTRTWRSDLYDQWVQINKALNDLSLARTQADQVSNSLIEVYDNMGELLNRLIDDEAQ